MSIISQEQMIFGLKGSTEPQDNKKETGKVVGGIRYESTACTSTMTRLLPQILNKIGHIDQKLGHIILYCTVADFVVSSKIKSFLIEDDIILNPENNTPNSNRIVHFFCSGMKQIQ